MVNCSVTPLLNSSYARNLNVKALNLFKCDLWLGRG